MPCSTDGLCNISTLTLECIKIMESHQLTGHLALTALPGLGLNLLPTNRKLNKHSILIVGKLFINGKSTSILAISLLSLVL